MKFLNKYEYIAILVPSLVSFLPIIIFIIITFKLEFDIKTLGIGTLSLLILYLMGEFIMRPLGIKLEKKIFKKGKAFPTTRILLGKHKALSDKKLTKIKTKLKKDFQFSSKKTITYEEILEVTKQMRYKVGDGRLLIHYNAIYGFFRNIIGAIFIPMMLCILFSIISGEPFLIIIFGGMYIGYSLLYLFRSSILHHFGTIYAINLFENYLYSD